MPCSNLPPHSLMPLQSAPARRCGARRRINIRPPPRSPPTRSRRLRSWPAAVIERRHAALPHVRPAHARAAAQRHRQRHPMPGIASPARPRASTRHDPCHESVFPPVFPLRGLLLPPPAVCDRANAACPRDCTCMCSSCAACCDVSLVLYII